MRKNAPQKSCQTVHALTTWTPDVLDWRKKSEVENLVAASELPSLITVCSIVLEEPLNVKRLHNTTHNNYFIYFKYPKFFLTNLHDIIF